MDQTSESKKNRTRVTGSSGASVWALGSSMLILGILVGLWLDSEHVAQAMQDVEQKQEMVDRIIKGDL